LSDVQQRDSVRGSKFLRIYIFSSAWAAHEIVKYQKFGFVIFLYDNTIFLSCPFEIETHYRYYKISTVFHEQIRENCSKFFW
jgi:hypothetical protein